jgi:hypothetical protein
VKLLLENGARPDFEDEPGHTPLSRAVTKTVVELLKSPRTPDSEDGDSISLYMAYR